jgi:hypothetical protein
MHYWKKCEPVIVAAAVSVIFAATTGPSWGQLSFRENYADKIVSQRDFGDIYYDQIATGKFTARFKFQLPGPLELRPDTNLDITIGGWSWGMELSELPRFVTGATKIKISLLSADGKKSGQLSLAISRGFLTGAVTAKTGSTARYDVFEASPAAANFTGTSGVIAGNESLDFSFTIEDSDSTLLTAMAEPLPLLTGVASIKTVTKGPRDYQDEFELSRIKVSAAGPIVVVGPEEEEEEEDNEENSDSDSWRL